MAKLKLNSLLADLRGRFGSVVISSNRAGFFIKTLRTPTNPRSFSQSLHRSLFSRLVSSWSTLTPAERDTWVTFAARADNERLDWFGDGYYPSARDQFISIGIMRALAGAVFEPEAPTSDRPAALPDMLAGIDPLESLFTSYIDHDAPFDGSIAYVHAAVSITANHGRITPPVPFRFLGIHAVTDTWPWDIQAAFTALYGPTTAAGYWFLDLTPVSADFRTGSTIRIRALLGEEYP